MYELRLDIAPEQRRDAFAGGWQSHADITAVELHQGESSSRTLTVTFEYEGTRLGGAVVLTGEQRTALISALQ